MIVNLNEASFERLRDGDEEVFNGLFNGYFRPLYVMVFRIVQRADVAEEIVIETLFKLWDKRKQMKDPRHVHNFLYRAARNAAIDFQRDVTRSGISNTGDANDIADLAEEGASREMLYEELDHGLILRRIDEAVNKLPQRRQQVFRMYWIEGRGVDEIALAMDVRPSTVYNQLAAAYKTIRKNMGDRSL